MLRRSDITCVKTGVRLYLKGLFHGLFAEDVANKLYFYWHSNKVTISAENKKVTSIVGFTLQSDYLTLNKEVLI